MHKRSRFEPGRSGQFSGFQRTLPFLAAFAVMCLALDGRAEYTLLTGQLHGTEPQIAPLHDLCPENLWTRHTYSVIQPLTVSHTGQYRLVSVANIGAVYVALHQDGFDPADPLRGRLAAADFDWDYNVSLSHELVAGEEYQLVVSPMCGERYGLWGVIASGPGQVSSPAGTPLDPVGVGMFEDSDPKLQITADCEPDHYRQIGPFRMARSGYYELVDISAALGRSLCAWVYSAPLDPDRPQDNQLASYTPYNNGTVELLSGQDYYIVVQAVGGLDLVREYLFSLSAFGPVYIDPLMSGSWYNTETPGQGFFIDALGKNEEVFLGWFTFDVERPNSAPAELGDAAHRWLTALGYAEGNLARLEVEVTTGGAFAQGDPSVRQAASGEIELEFFDCYQGEIRYDLGSAGLSGTIPIERLNQDGGRSCESRLNSQLARPALFSTQ